MPDVKYENLPFGEAIDYFKGKINLPTQKWTDLWEGMHSRGFVVAGAMKSELLSDMRGAVEKGIKDGTSIQEFRKDFDGMVKRHGWNYKGERGWRTGVIFNTNMTVAYTAGRYKQMIDPVELEVFPYWRYRTMDDSRVRLLHASWHNTVLKHDDPWWNTHYPPNGWGCRCEVETLTEKQADRLKGGEAVNTKAPKDGEDDWTNKDTGEVMKVPEGIDPGWAYNPGETAWGRMLSENVMKGWTAQGAAAWEKLNPEGWKNYGRPERIPLDTSKTSPDYRIKKTRTGIKDALTNVLGGKEKTFSYTSGDFRYDILVNAETLSRHIDPARGAYLPYLRETIENPYEVWLSFEKHKGTGKVLLRQRIIKAIRTGKKEGVVVVTNAVNGFMEAWTFIPVKNMEYLNKQRSGGLIWKRD